MKSLQANLHQQAPSPQNREESLVFWGRPRREGRFRKSPYWKTRFQNMHFNASVKVIVHKRKRKSSKHNELVRVLRQTKSKNSSKSCCIYLVVTPPTITFRMLFWRCVFSSWWLYPAVRTPRRGTPSGAFQVMGKPQITCQTSPKNPHASQVMGQATKSPVQSWCFSQVMGQACPSVTPSLLVLQSGEAQWAPVPGPCPNLIRGVS